MKRRYQEEPGEGNFHLSAAYYDAIYTVVAALSETMYLIQLVSFQDFQDAEPMQLEQEVPGWDQRTYIKGAELVHIDMLVHVVQTKDEIRAMFRDDDFCNVSKIRAHRWLVANDKDSLTYLVEWSDAKNSRQCTWMNRGELIKYADSLVQVYDSAAKIFVA